MPSPKPSPRKLDPSTDREQLISLVAAGKLSLSQIGDLFGISKQRVSAIFKAHQREHPVTRAVERAYGKRSDQPRSDRVKPNLSTIQGRFGANLAAARIAVGLTRKEAARLTGVNESSWAKYERGAMPPNVTTLAAMAKALNTPAGSLLHGTTETEEAKRLIRRAIPRSKRHREQPQSRLHVEPNLSTVHGRIGANIRAARLSLHVTYSDAAEHCGILPASWSHYETGKQGPTLEGLVRIARGLGVGIEVIVAGIEKCGVSEAESTHPRRRKQEK